MFLLFVVFISVCIGFNLRRSTLLGFLVGRTTSFHESILLSGLTSKRTCPRTQCLGKLIENRSLLPCSLDMKSLQHDKTYWSFSLLSQQYLRQMKAKSIQFCLRGGGDLKTPNFLPLILNLSSEYLL